MFKPPFHDLCAALRHQAANLGDLLRFKAMIEGHREVVQPDLAFVARLEDMHMNSLGQVVAVKTDAIPVLDEHRRHDRDIISTRTGLQLQNDAPPDLLEIVIARAPDFDRLEYYENKIG